MENAAEHRPSAERVRAARADNAKMRERDLAAMLGISEAELVAAHCGHGAVRIRPDVSTLLHGLEAVGEVMALTRNENAVHEKIGVYDKPMTGGRNAMMLGKDIDLRIFPSAWTHGFAVEKRGGDGVRRSLQFFDAAGEAVHKVHVRPGSSLSAFEKLVDRLADVDQSAALTVEPPAPRARDVTKPVDIASLRARWSAMSDVHQFFGLLRSFKLSRHAAIRLIGDEFAWRLDRGAASAMLRHAADLAIPIMCFVGNRGCIQIHSGAIANVKPMGPWINIMDAGFHLHLREDRIAEMWAVRKPVAEGHVTSLEAFDTDGELIIQFFGRRDEGEGERDDWRALAEGLPRIPCSSAA